MLDHLTDDVLLAFAVKYCTYITLSAHYSWGSLNEISSPSAGENYNMATVLVITFPVVNYGLTDPRTARAAAWESVYLDFLGEYRNPNLSIAYQAEVRSLSETIINTLSLGDCFPG